MPNPKTIKEIEQEAIDNIILQAEHSANDVKFIEAQIRVSFLYLLDEVEKRLPEERIIPIGMAGWAKNRDTGYNDCLKQVIKILSDMREGK